MSLNVKIKKDFGTFVLKTEFETDQGVLGILGESGCGKSMTLRCIAGIMTPDEGYIELNGKVLFDSEKRINLKPQERHVGLLFQNYALFPNMTVEQNLMMGIKAYEKDKSVCKKSIREMMERFYLTGLEKNKPGQLSGGQQQRVALARILLSKPELLMLDEPFSALDEFLRWNLELELSDVLKEFDGSTLFVSHNRDEIYRICDRVCVMNKGTSSPVVTVKELFLQPESRAAAYLSGCKNFSAVEIMENDLIYASDWGVYLRTDSKPRQKVTCVGIRSHYIFPVLQEHIGREKNVIKCQVERIIEDVFGMIIMAVPISNLCITEQNMTHKKEKADAIRMEISKETWKSYCEKQDIKKEIYIGFHTQDIMLLQ